ncbi:hypothetical protein EYF80_009316 [Liparis tanakae]|uniref:Uncharacterized protein n=1 Tax=Liparis tanakae TaxID=230148 RepID=A0A4Z2ISN2_9TELE|nr:hypothetical protein EYF80_009316 [Liparis tanakae]
MKLAVQSKAEGRRTREQLCHDEPGGGIQSHLEECHEGEDGHEHSRISLHPFQGWTLLAQAVVRPLVIICALIHVTPFDS